MHACNAKSCHGSRCLYTKTSLSACIFSFPLSAVSLFIYANHDHSEKILFFYHASHKHSLNSPSLNFLSTAPVSAVTVTCSRARIASLCFSLSISFLRASERMCSRELCCFRISTFCSCFRGKERENRISFHNKNK